MGILDFVKGALACTTDTLAELARYTPTLSAVTINAGGVTVTLVPRPEEKGTTSRPHLAPEGPFLPRGLLAFRRAGGRHRPDSPACPDACPDSTTNALDRRRFRR